jgi:hypothetical protein
MSDVDTAQTGALVAPVETSEAPQVEQAQVQESTTEHVETQQDKHRDEKGRFVPQERVNEITRARREAERRAQYLEQQLTQLQGQQQQTQPHSERPPSLADFQTPDEWAAAVLEHAERRASKSVEGRLQQLDQQRSQQDVVNGWEAKERDFATQTPDYLDRIHELTEAVQFHPDFLGALAGSDHGPAIAYHLANHLDVADRLSRMSPVAAAVELGRIEAQLTAPKPNKPVTKAPEPAPTLGGSSPMAKDLSKMDYESYKRARMGG